jgi:hypothetical protein
MSDAFLTRIWVLIVIMRERFRECRVFEPVLAATGADPTDAGQMSSTPWILGCKRKVAAHSAPNTQSRRITVSHPSTDIESSESMAHATESTLRHLAGGLLALLALVAFLDEGPVVVLSGLSAGPVAALGSVGLVLLLLSVPFLCVLTASWAGVSMLVGVAQVMDLVERHTVARIEARVLRSRQGASLVPAPAPRGVGAEVSADAGDARTGSAPVPLP